MRKLAIVLLAVLGMNCIANADDPVTAGLAAGASSSRDSAVVMAGLNTLPSAPMPVYSPTSTPPGAFAPIVAIAPATRVAPPALGADKHPFLDKANWAIFASLVAARAMDPISTWQFRRHGLHESQLTDGFVDNKPLFATYSASLVAGQISASYMFHRMGWHKVERISAIIHTGVVTEAVVHNYRIGTKH